MELNKELLQRTLDNAPLINTSIQWSKFPNKWVCWKHNCSISGVINLGLRTWKSVLSTHHESAASSRARVGNASSVAHSVFYLYTVFSRISHAHTYLTFCQNISIIICGKPTKTSCHFTNIACFFEKHVQ